MRISNDVDPANSEGLNELPTPLFCLPPCLLGPSPHALPSRCQQVNFVLRQPLAPVTVVASDTGSATATAAATAGAGSALPEHLLPLGTGHAAGASRSRRDQGTPRKKKGFFATWRKDDKVDRDPGARGAPVLLGQRHPHR